MCHISFVLSSLSVLFGGASRATCASVLDVLLRSVFVCLLGVASGATFPTVLDLLYA